MKQEKCEWKYDDIDDFYQTSCGLTWFSSEGTLEENKMNYCPQCGKKIKLVK